MNPNFLIMGRTIVAIFLISKQSFVSSHISSKDSRNLNKGQRGSEGQVH